MRLRCSSATFIELSFCGKTLQQFSGIYIVLFMYHFVVCICRCFINVLEQIKICIFIILALNFSVRRRNYCVRVSFKHESCSFGVSFGVSKAIDWSWWSRLSNLITIILNFWDGFCHLLLFFYERSFLSLASTLGWSSWVLSGFLMSTTGDIRFSTASSSLSVLKWK